MPNQIQNQVNRNPYQSQQNLREDMQVGEVTLAKQIVRFMAKPMDIN